MTRRVDHPRFVAALREVQESLDAAWLAFCTDASIDAGVDAANGFRFAARETDRPNVPPGNEHAIRVASAVARTRDRYSPRARCGYEVGLPYVLAGELPTTSEAQALKAIINTLTDEQLETVVSYEELIR